MTTGERQLQQSIMAQREPHRWGRGDVIEFNQNRVVVEGVHWRGNEAGYAINGAHIAQAELIERVHKKEEPERYRQQHRNTQAASRSWTRDSQQRKSNTTVTTSALTAPWPLNCVAISPGHWIPYSGAGLRYVH